MSSPSSIKTTANEGSSIWRLFSIRQNHLLSHILLVTVACFIYYLQRYHFDDTNEAEQQQSNNSNNNNNVIHALSGSLGSALSITIFYPLETVRTRLQVGDSNITASKWSFSLVYNIYQNEGLQGLYRGWWSLLVALMSLNFCYFYCFHSLRLWLLSDSLLHVHKVLSLLWKKNGQKMILDLVAGYLAGCVAVIVTGPLWLVNTRLKLQGVASVDQGGSSSNNNNGDAKKQQKYKGIFHGLYTIYKQEGLFTLWKGTFTSIILSLNPAIQLAAYEMLKRHHLIVRNGSRVVGWIVSSIIYHVKGSTSTATSYSQDNDPVVNNSTDGSAIEHFINALLSKFVATLITYPIQLIQTRQRWSKTPTANNDNNKTNEETTSKRQRRWFGASTIHDLTEIIQQQGFRGLYRGLESKLMQTCLNSALMFVAYEELVEFLTRLFR
jgi:adenine nucleotide transporter 17